MNGWLAITTGKRILQLNLKMIFLKEKASLQHGEEENKFEG